MGNGGTKENQNVYFRARKQAALYNEKLSSREGAAEMLGISPSTLADYELGITKFVPVDKVVLMADLYNCPELRTGYCKYECPIGKHISLATSVSGIEGIALRLIREFDSNEITHHVFLREERAGCLRQGTEATGRNESRRGIEKTQSHG